MGDDRTTATSAILPEPELDEGAAAERCFLVVYYGQDEGGRTRVVPLPEGAAVTIGRLEGNAISYDHEALSRRHARVIRRGADVLVEDLSSRNGTRVNGVPARGQTRVSTGDEISAGPLTLVVGVTTSMRRRMRIGTTTDLEERIEAEVNRALRYHRPLGLMMLRLEGSEDAAALALGRIASGLRRMDCLAEYGPDEFAVVLPEADRPAAEAAAHRAVTEGKAGGLAHRGVAVHVGLAVFPEDGSQAGELVSRARAALRAARSGGGAGGVAVAPHEVAVAGGDIVVVDPLMKRVFALARKIADQPITVLILGETGVGKEILADALHQYSKRAGKPLVPLNCASLPETLLESELFGHERGAFTGADRRKIGYFEAARGGTLFLDEIGEIPLGLQAKLLRVLEQRVITRLGGTEPVHVDVRVVCATNRDLEAEVKRGRFREDLYFRVSGFTLFIPPLRDRRIEIPPLANHFARQFARELGQSPATLTSAARAVLESYDWPGNVRELRNAIERAVVLQSGGRIEQEHLPERVRDGAGRQAAAAGAAEPAASVRDHVANVERAAVVDALAACGGNQTHTARRLGVSRWAVIRLLQKYGLKSGRR